MPPLSQQGMVCLPKNPRQRAHGSEPSGTLERVNERLGDKSDLVLHPTKGFRKISAKRSAAARITEEMKRGVPTTMKQIKAQLDWA